LPHRRLSDGYPHAGECITAAAADLSPNIRFVSKNSAEPTFDILTYRVTQ